MGCDTNHDEVTVCTVQVELLHRILDEVALLSSENYKESTIDSDLEYNPDWGQLLQYAVNEKCLTITARYNSILVGYLIVLIGPFKHSKNIEYADIETFYVNKSFREGGLVLKMIHLMDKELKDKVEFILCSSPINTRIDSLFKYLGYKPVEIVHYKRLGNGRKETAGSTR